MDFALQIDKWCTETEEKLETVMHYGITEFCRRLIARTPYGMPERWVAHRAPPGYRPGTARAGWHVSSGAPVVALPSRPDVTGQLTLSTIVAALPGQISGKVLYISNNVPYIEELERGHSPQSPPNAMVGLTVMEFNTIVAQKTREVASVN